MLKWLSLANLLLTLSLIAWIVGTRGSTPQPAKAPEVLRVKRIEIMDAQGRTAAMFGYEERSLRPKLSLLDGEGREVVFLTADSGGRATMYFQSKRTENVVSLGYLWGSDVDETPGEDDPLGSWGMRIRGTGGYLKSFDSFEHDWRVESWRKRSIHPVQVLPEYRAH